MSDPARRGGHSPLVTVVIACYNHARFLSQAIDSALAQTYRNIEIIVVDDGSTDDTPAVAGAYGSAIRYIRQINAGPAAAKNTGVRHATGDLIALLDADDRWLPQKLETQVPMIPLGGNVGMVHGGYAVIDAGGSRTGPLHQPSESTSFHDLLALNTVGNLTAVCTRQAALAAGPFDESLSAVEDWDMWIRISARHQIRATPTIVAEYRQHGANISGDPYRMFKRRMSVIDKHRRTHASCSQCARAVTSGREEVRGEFARQMSALAAAAAQRGDRLTARRLELLAAWRRRGLIARLRDRVRRVLVAAGISAR